MNRIVVINETDLTDGEVQHVVDALKTQISRDFEPIWGISADVTFVSGTPPPGGWWLILLDDATQAKDLGYHDLTDAGLPLAKVFVSECRRMGLNWTVTASHELLEMLVDPGINLTVLRQNDASSLLVAYEACDACDADQFGYDINGVTVSDFVYPSWFEPAHQSSISQFDHCGRVSRPFECLAGGYQTFMEVAAGAKWQQGIPDGDQASSSRIVTDSRDKFSTIEGTRRERRRRHDSWKRSLRSPHRVRGSGLHLVNNGAQFAFATREGGLKSIVDEIDNVRAALSGVVKPSRSNIDPTQLGRILTSALKQIHTINKRRHLDGAVPDDYQISLVLSAINDPPAAQAPMRMADLVGTGKYEDLDIRWAESLIDRVVSRKFKPFPNHIDLKLDPVIPIPDPFTVAIAGDWGTGNNSSKDIAKWISECHPHCTIHLGDVYYAGTENEQKHNFLGIWPAGSNDKAPSFALNGNHEMYSGGTPYFTDVLRLCSQFRAQQSLSYFALNHKYWLIIALDSAYFAESYTYQRGDLGAMQADWLKQLGSQARASGQQIILLTHHHGIDIGDDGREVNFQQPLWGQVTSALDGGPEYWYWGHVHAGIAFSPYQSAKRTINPRCVGHGGVPYAPFGDNKLLGNSEVRVAWAESATAQDSHEPRRAFNGFVLIKLDGNRINEQFIRENGSVAFTAPSASSSKS